jgi:hypothetical protein
MKLFKGVVLVLILFACNSDDYKFEYEIVITDEANNMGGLNTVFDDFNSDLPYPAQRTAINFSSNRNSQGLDFDIVGSKLDFSYHSKDDILNVSIPYDVPPRDLELIAPKINTENDELGPYTYISGDDLIFMYATNPQDTFMINFVEYKNYRYSSEVQNISNPLTVTGVNNTGDNMYPSVDASGRRLYFCSNRNDSDYSIYSMSYDAEISRQILLYGAIEDVKKDTVLSSDFDDKCPYIKDNFMVFSSNRDGSYDLWYARYLNDSWSSPLKFRSKINSEYNDYRPIIFNILGFNLMIFSSDRPGGKGGYDLYIVRIDDYLY